MSPINQHIVILGGGTAGWLTANIIAAEFDPAAGISVTLVESPTTPTIGVGEGTWPSMRSTLMKIGNLGKRIYREVLRDAQARHALRALANATIPATSTTTPSLCRMAFRI